VADTAEPDSAVALDTGAAADASVADSGKSLEAGVHSFPVDDPVPACSCSSPGAAPPAPDALVVALPALAFVFARMTRRRVRRVT
jgi:MYXO-CTERM domain-containing protein